LPLKTALRQMDYGVGAHFRHAQRFQIFPTGGGQNRRIGKETPARRIFKRLTICLHQFTGQFGRHRDTHQLP